ncbi:helix-turn-helix domain-containing protein [Ilumatobacter sp.]|uniref:helix-turn-helix domain-containing protein n=1 Tax=Ilumatobacter sp. TaxID=1967498 RepID=UPI003B52F8A3
MATPTAPDDEIARDISLVDDVVVARLLLDPLRSRVLAALATPGSASTVAAELGETRQRVNHHLRTLEEHGLVRLVEERPRRGLVERIVVATSDAVLLAPSLAGDNAPHVRPDDRRDERLASRYLLAIAARLVSEVGDLARSARAAGRPLPTLTVDADVRFATAADRAEFARRLTATIHDLVAEFHDEAAPGGRWHRLVVAAHPRPTRDLERTAVPTVAPASDPVDDDDLAHDPSDHPTHRPTEETP